jgi:hypothetical protein|tara:strand:- start:377 stop:808 length:432 start_codon:yes stop_codon:yes gene_type:complete
LSAALRIQWDTGFAFTGEICPVNLILFFLVSKKLYLSTVVSGTSTRVAEMVGFLNRTRAIGGPSLHGTRSVTLKALTDPHYVCAFEIFYAIKQSRLDAGVFGEHIGWFPASTSPTPGMTTLACRIRTTHPTAPRLQRTPSCKA